MRISDWSSDVCSSDLNALILGVAPFDPYELYSRKDPVLKGDDFKGKVWATTSATDARAVQLLGGSPTGMSSSDLYLSFDRGVINATPRPLITGMGRSLRSEERRVGTECVCPCSSRGWSYH